MWYSFYFSKNIESNQSLIVCFFHYIDQLNVIFIHGPCLSYHYIRKALSVLMANFLLVHWIPHLVNYEELSSSFLFLLCNIACEIVPISIVHMPLDSAQCYMVAWMGGKFVGEYACMRAQSCPTLCDPIDSSPPASAIPGILQARTLEWVAISFSMRENGYVYMDDWFLSMFPWNLHNAVYQLFPHTK